MNIIIYDINNINIIKTLNRAQVKFELFKY